MSGFTPSTAVLASGASASSTSQALLIAIVGLLALVIAGLVCMACRRAYEPGLRSCPHDGNELVPFPVYNATRPRRAKNYTEPAGVVARICPVCATKYDLNARFCGHDAGGLVVIN